MARIPQRHIQSTPPFYQNNRQCRINDALHVDRMVKIIEVSNALLSKGEVVDEDEMNENVLVLR